ncbi:MAG: hypothetical protein V4516_10050 [Pseudomonadota bacterium]
MAHEWIFEVLQDMRSYSQKNGLPLLMAQLDAALLVARTEIGAGNLGAQPHDPDDKDD